MTEHRPPGILDRLTAIERRVLEEQITRYYSTVAKEELEAGRAPSDQEFPTVARRGPLRRLHEITLGCATALAGTILWTMLVDRFSG